MVAGYVNTKANSKEVLCLLEDNEEGIVFIGAFSGRDKSRQQRQNNGKDYQQLRAEIKQYNERVTLLLVILVAIIVLTLMGVTPTKVQAYLFGFSTDCQDCQAL
jgi:Na+/H+ antiporter NhaC